MSESSAAPRYTPRLAPDMANTLDISRWRSGESLVELYAHLAREIRVAAAHEVEMAAAIRQEIIPRLGAADIPGGALHRVSRETISRVHRALLFTGQTQGVNGVTVAHDTLPAMMAQIGVCLVSYQGEAGSWVQHLFRREITFRQDDLFSQAEQYLLDRERRPAVGGEAGVTDLSRKAIMAYAERAVLSREATARWRMGHGSPVPLEMLTGGGGSAALQNACIHVLRELLLTHRRVVFVSDSLAYSLWLTIGLGLEPGEYVVVDTLEPMLDQMLTSHSWRDEQRQAATQFVKEVGPQWVVGVYRAERIAPPAVFFAHRDHVHVAAALAMADSALQQHRGFPMLLDLANLICRAVFSRESFVAAIRQGYVDAGLAMG